MYKSIFKEIGLNQNEAVIYEYLIRNGESTAGKIIESAPIKRGVTYNALATLKEKKLIAEKKAKNSKIPLFVPAHPNKLKNYVEEKEREVNKAKNALDANLATFISDFNLVSGQPGVQIYEGKTGIIKTLDDSLTSKTEILAYGDIELIVKYIDEINKKYVSQREKLKIKKRGLMVDNAFARKYLKNYHLAITNTKLIKLGAKPFKNIMQIYDDKISYIILSDDFLMGIIITNESIYQMHKSLFEFIWENTKGLELKK